MNAIEIEQAVSELFAQPFDADEFPYVFLEAFGNKSTTIKRLRSGETNKSDRGGVLQSKNIHIAIAPSQDTTATLKALRESPATAKHKVEFILSTDGDYLEAENRSSGEILACPYGELPNHFGFFLSLAGIRTVRQIRDSAFDIRATRRLNQLYIQLLKDNPQWGNPERRHDMNHFMARLIFCFFAEDTGIFDGDKRFSATIEQMSTRDGSDTAWVISELFRSMNLTIEERQKAQLRSWALNFPYVNGSLFDGSLEVPRFSQQSRSHLLHIGGLDWRQINPDIFGSMIQAVADETERSTLGMHYTSVPNILKVLNPLFLDDLRAELAAAGNSKVKLLNLRQRISHIRIFDPACGSGNFLVIAYKEMRAIEQVINEKRGEAGRRSEIPLTNFRGIELRDFSAEIARLALVIAEYQCNERYLGHREALRAFLPLATDNWISCGNALRLDWLAICPPSGCSPSFQSDDMFQEPANLVDFDNEGGETYICGNPPYYGSQFQDKEQKADLENVLGGRCKNWKSLDYIAGWFLKAADYCLYDPCCRAAFVSTNSICQGKQVSILWSLLFELGLHIDFAHTSFKWANLASHNAGVTVVIVGFSTQNPPLKKLYISATTIADENLNETATSAVNGPLLQEVANINGYLVAADNLEIQPQQTPLSSQMAAMSFGNMPNDGSHLLLSRSEREELPLSKEQKERFVRRIYGSSEFIRGLERYCLWIRDEDLAEAESILAIKRRIDAVRAHRLGSSDKGTNKLASRAYQMREMNIGKSHALVIPGVSSESREFLPVGLIDNNSTITNAVFALYDTPLWHLALIASRLHLVWITTVCGKLETRLRYSNTLGWNTFPVPLLTAQNQIDLTESAEAILLAREVHFPATIADLYKPGAMPENLRHAHDRNDEIIERIYIGRRFKNDSERLEKLFDLYRKMTVGRK